MAVRKKIKHDKKIELFLHVFTVKFLKVHDRKRKKGRKSVAKCALAFFTETVTEFRRWASLFSPFSPFANR
jgi:hypothetical protein